jgi:hypothetical protein
MTSAFEKKTTPFDCLARVDQGALGNRVGEKQCPAARITFSRANATFLAAVGVSERRFADQHQLELELKQRVEEGRFPPEYVVISD